ncbi:MAG: UvrD-helicase domain-containing protein [Clostridiales bacterium]|nr:UvrD-helicase domain-containing protein [Clostridiales bacterium]
MIDVGQYNALRDEIRNMILSRLNAGQRLAVETGRGPVLCLAGAGSGKTTAMVYRILHLLAFGPDYDPGYPPPDWAGEEELAYLARFLTEQGKSGERPVLSRQLLSLIGGQGVPMYDILAITFTNKAAREMRERLEALLGEALGDMWVMTFHSACLRILKRESRYLEGYQDDFSIYDAGDQEQVIKEILRGLRLDDKEHHPKAYLSWISNQKSAMKLPPVDYAPPSEDKEHMLPLVYARYQQSLVRNNAMDFDDLLLQTAILFRRHPECLEKYRKRFRYIMVDEYQDTNHIQYRLVKMLAEEHGNICVVGDDDQSIYSFRQADIRNILDFERDFPGATVIRVEQNYRSTGHILDAANQLVANNRERKEKKLWTEKEKGDKLYCYRASDDKDEARFVCSRIQMTRERGGKFSDHAVLMRTNAQSRQLEEWFAACRIPYVVIGGIRFYERREIKDILAYLKLIANPEDQVAFRRVVNLPRRGIGDATVNRVVAHSLERGMGLAEALSDREGLGLPPRADRSLEEFRLLYAKLRELAAVENVGQLSRSILMESGYRRMLQEAETLENRDRLANLQEFLNKADDYDRTAAGSLAEFLGEISLITDMDLAEDEEQKGAVQIMTMHMAKGLEFPQVFMVGMEERVFPHFRSVTDSEIEEERRLCYVAMTRAKEKLYLSWASRRNQYGSYAEQLPSRFLREIPEYLMEEYPQGGRGASGMSGRRAGYDAPGASAGSGSGAGSKWGSGLAGGAEGKAAAPPGRVEAYKAGDKILHQRWGPGVVVGSKGAGAGLIYTVAFPDKGLRDLQADIAPISRLE